MFTRLTALLMALLTLSTASCKEGDSAPITILGINLDSSVKDIEGVLGKCEPQPERPHSFLCGRVDKAMSGYFGGYQLDEDDRSKINYINIPCSVINGCEYSEEDLASQISENLGLPEAKLVYFKEGSHISWMEIDGEAGDKLTVRNHEILQVHGIRIERHNYQKPPLKLK